MNSVQQRIEAAIQENPKGSTLLMNAEDNAIMRHWALKAGYTLGAEDFHSIQKKKVVIDEDCQRIRCI